jgi:hypothetical protein
MWSDACRIGAIFGEFCLFSARSVDCPIVNSCRRIDLFQVFKERS